MDRRDLVLQYLRDDSVNDARIIEVLLLLLNDWEIRAAVDARTYRRSVKCREEKEAKNVPDEIRKAAGNGNP